MSNAALNAAIEAALSEEPPTEDTAPEAEVTDEDSDETPGSTEVGAEVETDEDDGEIPTHLFGVDLSLLPDDDARKEFLHEWTEQNKTINRLQREKANLERQSAGPPSEEAPTPEPVDVSALSDEAIAQALGLDLEETLDPAAARAAVSLARGFMDLRQTVEGLAKSTTTVETKRVWETSLDSLETKYGELPVSRVELLEWAAENGISDPEVAYWSQAGPIRYEVAHALEEKLAKVRKSQKKAATTPRPKSSAPVEGRLQSKNVKDAMREAAMATAQALGIDLPTN